MKSMPTKPELKPFYHIVPMPEGRVQLRSAYRSVIVNVPKRPGLMAALLPLLDGTRTIRQLENDCLSYSAHDVQIALQVLADKSLLYEGCAEQCSNHHAIDDQQLAFLGLGADATALREVLATATIWVAGQNSIAQAAVKQLQSLGVLRIKAAGASQDTDSRATWSAQIAQALDGETPHQVAADVGNSLEGVDVVIGCTDRLASHGFEALNIACVRARVPWLPVSVRGLELCIGPLVIPSETACFNCCEMRRRANLVFADEYIAFEKHITSSSARVRTQGMLLPYAQIAGAIVALEVVRFLTRCSFPISAGNLIRLDLLNYQMSVGQVLRVPRCNVCGVVAPVVKEWELCWSEAIRR